MTIRTGWKDKILHNEPQISDMREMTEQREGKIIKESYKNKG